MLTRSYINIGKREIEELLRLNMIQTEMEQIFVTSSWCNCCRQCQIESWYMQKKYTMLKSLQWIVKNTEKIMEWPVTNVAIKDHNLPVAQAKANFHIFHSIF